MQKGNTLIELLISAAVISLVLIAVAMSMMFSLKREALNRYRQSGIELANQAIEHLNFRRAELGWEVFASTFGAGDEQSFCFGDAAGAVMEYPETECASNDEDHVIQLMSVAFLRDVYIEKLTDTGVVRLKVTVTVRWWPDSQGERNYQLTREFTQQDY